MTSRVPSHLAVVFAFLVAVGLPSLQLDVVETTQAAPETTPNPTQVLLPDTFTNADPEVRDSRAVRSTFTPPVPLATPVPVDPNATPLAAPTLAPLPVAAAPAPVVAVMSWIHPIPLNIVQYFSAGHPALDILAPCGTPVVASLSGTITLAGWRNNGGGNAVTIDSGNGFVLEYNHMQAVALLGGWVNAGTIIGWVGATGWATGCHLHYTVIKNGIFQDPLAFL
jgi:murein DD-endopeptidase MepM/ murein hydrolase activator NlpD